MVLTVITYVRAEAEADAQLAVALSRYATAAPLPGYGVPLPRFGAPLIYSPNPTYKKTPKDFKKLIQTYSGLKDARGNSGTTMSLAGLGPFTFQTEIPSSDMCTIT